MSKTLVIQHEDVEYDLRTMSRDELMLLKLELQAKVDSISQQIGEAKSNLAVYGLHSDPDWYRRAEYAKRATGRNMQSVNFVLSQRNAEEKNRHNEQWPQRFVDAARLLLDKETFAQLAEMASNAQE